MNKLINVDIFSTASLKNLEKSLISYRDSLQHKVDIFAKTLADKGVDIAQVQIANLDAIFTGDLIASVHTVFNYTYKGGAVFSVVADSNHAFFVEFGTGQKGIDTPYPHPLPDGVTWEYAVGKTIRQSPVTGRYYWFYPGQDGKWHYTEGMPARPYMYNTAMELRALVEQTAREVFA